MKPLSLIVHEWKDCTRCPIGHLAHRHAFWRGDWPCQILFIGEGPGRYEDLKGVPFVGRAGQLLDQLIEESGCNRYAIGITNLVACRPTDELGGRNRPPSPREVANCEPRLMDSVMVSDAMIKLVVLLGRVPAEYFKSRRWPVLKLVHPSYMLRNGGIHSEHYRNAVKQLNRAIRKLQYERKLA